MKNKKKNRFKKFLITVFTIGLIVLTVYNVYVMYQNIEIKNDYEYKTQKLLSTESVSAVDNNSYKSKKTADMIEKTTNSVVGISRLKTTGGSILNNVASDELGLGTGIVVTDDGYILSNSHVTGDKYATCYVTINENTYTGSVVWSDSNLDLSITKVLAKNLECANLGNSDGIRVGETTYAIGNPIGYEFKKTVTSGIISALNRTIKINEDDSNGYISDLIQTDATINPGNSGGPLINSEGEVIGINTVKITSAEGIGFAIPINIIKPVVESFKQKGTFEEASLGIYAYDNDIAEYLNLKSKINKGVYISEITVNGPAYGSELKEGDLIVSIDGNTTETINAIRKYIYTKLPGDTVVLKIIKGDREKEVNIVLGKK
mgnify:FL=1